MLKITSRTDNEKNISIIYLDGHIETNSFQAFEQELNNMLKQKFFKIIINCSDLKYINSAGLGVIVGLIEEIRDQNGDIKFCCMNENVSKIFDLVGFNQCFKIFDKEEQAINAFEQN